MGTFDISRINFDVKKHYTSVRMQQGRVLTDDDWNEKERISESENKATLIDIIGPYGSPDDGFLIKNVHINITPGPNPDPIDFEIMPGTMYLGGLKLDLEERETFRLQKDWLQHKFSIDTSPNVANGGRFDLVYIEAWQQPVSAIEDSSLLEIALGGIDTTTRLRNMRRVKLATNIGQNVCKDAWTQLKNRFQNNGLGVVNENHERVANTQLKVGFIGTGLPTDLCTPNSIGGYLGAENQAIRVQIVDRTHFTWGFDNGAPYYRVTIAPDFKTVTMLTEPKDQYHWPLNNQVVEILPWSAVLSNGEKIATLAGHLSKVNTSYNPDTGTFTLQNPITAAFGDEWEKRTDKGELDNQQPAKYYYMRIWNRGTDLSSPSNIPFVSGTPIPLGNTGLQLTFTGNDRQAYDYWVIAARPETPTKVVPWDLEIGVKAHGLRRYFAPLAVIRWTMGAEGIPKAEIIHDCRKKFDPLTEQDCCCIDAIPGPGWESIFEQFRDDQDICVCFRNGIYELEKSVTIANKGNIKFTGGGNGSQIIIKNNETAINFYNCKDIVIRDLSIRNNGIENVKKHLNGALNIVGCENILLGNLTVICQNSNDKAHRQNTCITINDNAKQGLGRTNKSKRSSNTIQKSIVSIRDCRILIDGMQTGILLIDTKKAIIERNVISSIQTSANQAIVVAGTRPQDTYIKDNTITGARQGIHVGTSNNKANPRNIPMMAGPVLITGNHIITTLKFLDTAERHGIFVGNCYSLVIKDNFIELNKVNADREQNYPAINGIRVYGHYGKRVIIRDNHTEGFDYLIRKKGVKNVIKNYGIFIHYLNRPEMPRWWIVEANVTKHLRIEGLDKLYRTAKMTFADHWQQKKSPVSRRFKK